VCLQGSKGSTQECHGSENASADFGVCSSVESTSSDRGTTRGGSSSISYNVAGRRAVLAHRVPESGLADQKPRGGDTWAVRLGGLSSDIGLHDFGCACRAKNFVGGVGSEELEGQVVGSKGGCVGE